MTPLWLISRLFVLQRQDLVGDRQVEKLIPLVKLGQSFYLPYLSVEN